MFRPGSRFTKCGEYEVAWIDAILENQSDDVDQDDNADGDAHMKERVPLDAGAKDQSQSSSNRVMLRRNLYPQGHEAVFVGELRLGQLKQVLEACGIQAEIGEEKLLCGGQVGGVSIYIFEIGLWAQSLIVCLPFSPSLLRPLPNDQVTIKKSKDGGFDVEGALSEEYFRIRKLLYNQFCVL